MSWPRAVTHCVLWGPIAEAARTLQNPAWAPSGSSSCVSRSLSVCSPVVTESAPPFQGGYRQLHLLLPLGLTGCLCREASGGEHGERNSHQPCDRQELQPRGYLLQVSARLPLWHLHVVKVNKNVRLSLAGVLQGKSCVCFRSCYWSNQVLLRTKQSIAVSHGLTPQMASLYNEQLPLPSPLGSPGL